MAWHDGKRVGFGIEGICRQHALDPAGHAGLHYLFGAGRDASAGGDAARARLGLAATDVEELSSLVNNKTAVTIVE